MYGKRIPDAANLMIIPLKLCHYRFFLKYYAK